MNAPAEQRALEAWLPGRRAWLMIPSTLTNAAVAALAATYAAFTVEFDDSLQPWFFGVVAVVGLPLFLMAELLSARRLAPFARLTGASATLTVPALHAAIDSLRSFPGWLAKLTVASWLSAVGLVAAGFWTTAPVSPVVPFRLVLLGVLFGPMSAVVVLLWVGRRCHEALDQLSSVLPAHEVLSRAGPDTSRVRTLLMLFSGAMVALPAMILTDVARHLTAELARQVIAAPPSLREQVAAEGFGAMAWRLGLLALLALALGFVAARAGGAVIAGPMGRLADDAGRIARGELSRARVISAAGEVWQLTKVFARMKERLQEIITELGQAGRGIFTATGGLERAATRYARSATEQAAALNQTSATTEELAQSARQISTSAASVQDIARRTLEAAESGQGSTFAFRAAVERMRQDNTSISGAVERLQDRVHQIGRIVEVINQVSERSDLLALSAELEGTRAGEAGRGFSLVSSEMRRLAENVLESTAEVEGLISEIRQATRQTAEATARATALSGRGAALAGDVTEALTQVAELASQTANAARTISLATQQQQSGTDQLAEAMGDILSLTQQGAEASGRVGAAQGRLSTLAGTLSSLVDRFRLIP